MKNLTVKTKIYVSVFVILCLFILVNFYADKVMSDLNDGSTVIAKQVVPRANVAGELPYLMSEIRVREYRILSNNDIVDIKNTISEIQELYKTVQKDLDAYEKMTTQKQLFAQIKEHITIYMKYDKDIVDLVLQGKKDEALKIMFTDSRTAYDKLRGYINELLRVNTQIANKVDEDMNILYSTSKRNLYIIAGAILVFMIIGGVLFVRMVEGSVNELLRIARQMAKGDMRDKVKLTSDDEFGQLGRANNVMIDSFKELIMQIQRNSEQVAASAQELNASAEQSALVTNQVAESITDMAGAADRQLASLQATTVIVDNISNGLEEIAQNANKSMIQATDATQKARDGGEYIEKAVSQMEHIEGTVVRSAELVSKLGERSKEIGQIVDTISGIAGQTNLLALNAAIEAARAGEQGRGFAVVAEEVRKLAEQSQDATKQISTLISSIQSETQIAVFAMEEGTQDVKTGSHVVAEAGVAFREIIKLIDQVSKQVTQMNDIINNLAKGSQEVVSSVDVLNEMGKSIGSEAQTVSAATEQQSASMEEIASASRALAAIAQTLQESTQKFLV